MHSNLAGVHRSGNPVFIGKIFAMFCLPVKDAVAKLPHTAPAGCT